MHRQGVHAVWPLTRRTEKLFPLPQNPCRALHRLVRHQEVIAALVTADRQFRRMAGAVVGQHTLHLGLWRRKTKSD